MTVETALLAQIVLTLRSVFFSRGGFVLITAEQNRIYAITSKNRIITSCFGVIMISQFILGLYLTGYAAARGCESVTNYRLLFSPASMFQRYSSHRSHFRLI